MIDPHNDSPPPPPPSRTRQRTPSIFAPSAHQLKRLRELLGTDEAVRQAL